MPPFAPMKPWKATLLNLLYPGLGHVYLGQARRGFALRCAMVVAALAITPLLL